MQLTEACKWHFQADTLMASERPTATRSHCEGPGDHPDEAWHPPDLSEPAAGNGRDTAHAAEPSRYRRGTCKTRRKHPSLYFPRPKGAQSLGGIPFVRSLHDQ